MNTIKTPREIMKYHLGDDIFDKVHNDNLETTVYLPAVMEAIEAYHAQFEGEVIHAKALRKKGTDKWYIYLDEWISEKGHSFLKHSIIDADTYEFEDIPQDAELVDIEIRVKGGAE